MPTTTSNNGNTKVWFITGATKGIGTEIARAALAAGHTVIGTGRSTFPDDLIKHNKFHSLKLDVADQDAVVAAVEQAIKLGGGRVDVVVNNAGYVVSGAIEEVSDKQAREQYATNVFGAMGVTRAFLPYLRQQRSGHVINVTGVFGRVSAPGWGWCASSKYALEGLSEALVCEVKPFGIHVTLIEPGSTRTRILASGTDFGDRRKPEVYDGIRPTEKELAAIGGTQQGDPVRQGKAIVEIASKPNPPLHLALGSDSYGYITSGLKAVLAETEANKAISFSTDYPKEEN
jgi:NAD(P)-dependent dehydrogenase (short-subunit alcohol dehydrogenase family)